MLLLRPLSKPLRFVRRQLPPLNFITLHYAYFLATCLISAVIFWGASTPPRRVSFVDSLFLCVSAMTLAGLNTVNLSTVNTFQQIMLFLLILAGSAILVSAIVVHVRRTAFEKRFRAHVEEQTEKKKKDKKDKKAGKRSASRGRSWSMRGNKDTVEAEDGEREGKSGLFNEKDIDRDAVAFDQPARASTTDTSSKVFSNSETKFASASSTDQIGHLTFCRDIRFEPAHPQLSPHRRRRSSLISMQGVGARPEANLHRLTSTRSAAYPVIDEDSMSSPPPANRGDITRHFESFGGWVSRNSQFHGLTAKEREKLGGYEYRAVSLLAWLVPSYFVMWQLLGCLGCAAWVALNRPETARRNGLNPWWVGAFNAVSAFNNSGMSLLDANMTAFQTGYYLLLTMGLLILAGNTCFPIFLRLIIWTMWKTVSLFKGEAWQERKQTLRFLLDHPRRCYTNLFPSQHTWWLGLSVVMLNGIDWAAFEILNIGNQELESEIPNPGSRVIDGLFQAIAVRHGGFYVVAIPTLRIGLQVLYVVMMYIHVYPVSITMRNSNVYEERSLGIYAEDQDQDQYQQEPPTDSCDTLSPTPDPHTLLHHAKSLRKHFTPHTNHITSNSHFIRQQLRAQLAHDAWTIVLALFLIVIIESSQFAADPRTFSVFNFIFEIVSAYGCVGISIGLPNAAYSFCGSWHVSSKLILCAVMLRGRHRGLPVAIDKAVLLPGVEAGEAEEDDARIRQIGRGISRGRGEV